MLCSHMGRTEIETHCPTFPNIGSSLRWLILLVEFNLKYVARKTIKGSIVSDFCAENPVEGEDGKEDFPNEDILDIEQRA